MDNRQQLRTLIMMAAADGQFSESEINLLAERCASLGLSADEFQQVFTEATQSTALPELPTEHTEKTELLRDLLRMMAADGELSETEKRFFALAAVKMQLGPVAVDEIIAAMLGGPKFKS